MPANAVSAVIGSVSGLSTVIAGDILPCSAFQAGVQCLIVHPSGIKGCTSAIGTMAKHTSDLPLLDLEGLVEP